MQRPIQIIERRQAEVDPVLLANLLLDYLLAKERAEQDDAGLDEDTA